MFKHLLLISSSLLMLGSNFGQGKARTRKKVAEQPTSTVRIQPAEGDVALLPIGYTGHNASAVYAAIRRESARMRKSEFETTQDYKLRVQRIISSIPSVDSRLTFILADVNIEYDADVGAFKINTKPESVLFPTVFVTGEWNRQYGDFTSFFLVWNKKTAGTAVGRNAFGMKKRYVITVYTSLRLAVPVNSVRKLNRGLRLPAVPTSARLMYPGIRLAITGRLIPPYGGEETESDEATMSDPEEAHYFKYYVYFEPDTAVIYDIRTGVIYGVLDLAEEVNTNQRTRSNSDEPVMLEDLSVRRQKLAEARREYPPDHVFNKSEVTRSAVITYRPTPLFTEQARSAIFHGSVVLHLILRYDGTVEVVGSSEELPYGLSRNALDAAKEIKFQPAERNGKPVSQRIDIQYNFNTY